MLPCNRLEAIAIAGTRRCLIEAFMDEALALAEEREMEAAAWRSDLWRK